MTLFATLAALAWEYFRPERPDLPRHSASRWHRWLLDNVNAGGRQHGLLAWVLGALLPAMVLGGLGHLLTGIWSPLGWAFDVVVLYFCLGFRQASFLAASVARALQAQELERARRTLMAWRPGILAGRDEAALARQTVEEILRQSLVRLFGVLFWFFLLGVAGAALYLLTRLGRERWHVEPVFNAMTTRIAYWMDWLPARIAAFSFAVVGNFQDALECWRGQAHAWGDENEGVLLAAGAGALGLQLGGNIDLAEGELVRPALGVEELPGAPTVDNAVALIWRAALLWVGVLGLLWLGSL